MIIATNPPLSVGDTIIERVNVLSILGMRLSSNLRWGDHLHQIELKCRSDLYLIWRLRCMGMPPSDLSSIIRCMLLPKITYAFPAWCNVNKTELKRLERLYKRICKAGDLRDFGPLCSVLDDQVLRLYRSALDKAHSLNVLMPIANSTRYEMRALRLPLPKCRLETLKKHFVFRGTALFNERTIVV